MTEFFGAPLNFVPKASASPASSYFQPCPILNEDVNIQICALLLIKEVSKFYLLTFLQPTFEGIIYWCPQTTFHMQKSVFHK